MFDILISVRKMLFVILTCALALGESSETPSTPCPQPMPKCMEESTFNEKARETYRESDGILPSDEVLSETCNYTVQHLMCVRDYDNVCEVLDPPRILDSVVDAVVELCDETSDLRRTYSAHVDCVNGITFSNTCEESFRKTSRVPFEVHEALAEKRIPTECLILYGVRSCVIDAITENCGEEGGEAATTIFHRLLDVLSCTELNAEFYDDIFNQLDIV